MTRIGFALLMFIMGLMNLQEVNAQVKVGLRGGLNYTDLSNIQPRESHGFHVGTYLSISLAGLLTLEPGMQYAQRNYDAQSNFTTSHVKINYLELPVLVRIGLLPFIDIFGGPQASVLLGEKYTGDGPFDVKENLPKQELGAIAGIGIKLPLGINVQGSYDFGLTKPVYNGQEIDSGIFKISLGKDF